MATKVSEIERPNDVPEKIGKYVIINKIGKGSTGTVYLSHDPYYRRDVAIKVYNLEEDVDVERLRYDRQTGLVAYARQNLETFDTQTLEAVGAGAGLERTPAQEMGTGRLDVAGDPQGLFVALDRARAGDDEQIGATDPHSAHLDNGIVRLELS